MDTSVITKWTFYSCLFCVVTALLLGLASIWFEDFWYNTISVKLFATTFLLFAASLPICGIVINGPRNGSCRSPETMKNLSVESRVCPAFFIS